MSSVQYCSQWHYFSSAAMPPWQQRHSMSSCAVSFSFKKGPNLRDASASGNRSGLKPRDCVRKLVLDPTLLIFKHIRWLSRNHYVLLRITFRYLSCPVIRKSAEARFLEFYHDFGHVFRRFGLFLAWAPSGV